MKPEVFIPLTNPYAPRFPNVRVQLSGEDGNAFAIIGRCRRAARLADVSDNDIDTFTCEAKSGNYDNVIQTAMRWFTVE